MLEVIKYVDGDALVVIYKNYLSLDEEAKIDILKNLAEAEDYAIAQVHPGEKLKEDAEPKIIYTSSITTMKELKKQLALPKEEQDTKAINAFLSETASQINVEVFEKYTLKQLNNFIETFLKVLPKSFEKVLYRSYGFKKEEKTFAYSMPETVVREAAVDIAAMLKELYI